MQFVPLSTPTTPFQKKGWMEGSLVGALRAISDVILESRRLNRPVIRDRLGEA
jgi:hypothetical protein